MQISKLPKSSTFSEKVKSIVSRIPKGGTLSYKDVATLAGNEKAARAVARIMANNYDPKVPCHRVIRSDGSLGGYNRGGEATKHDILVSEQNN